MTTADISLPESGRLTVADLRAGVGRNTAHAETQSSRNVNVARMPHYRVERYGGGRLRRRKYSPRSQSTDHAERLNRAYREIPAR